MRKVTPIFQSFPVLTWYYGRVGKSPEGYTDLLGAFSISQELTKDYRTMNNTNDNTQNAKDNSPLIEGTITETKETTIDNSQNTIDNPVSNKPKYNVQNLRPYNKTDRILSVEEAKRLGSLGGKKSGQVRRQKKTMRETIINMISQEVDPDKLASMGVDIDSLGGDYTYQAAIIAAMLREAVNGDTKAMALLRDTMGEQPALHTVNQTEIITKEDMKTMDNLKQYLTG